MYAYFKIVVESGSRSLAEPLFNVPIGTGRMPRASLLTCKKLLLYMRGYSHIFKEHRARYALSLGMCLHVRAAWNLG